MIIRKFTEKDAGAYKEIRLEMLEESPSFFGMSSSEESLDKDLSYFSEMIEKSSIFGCFKSDKQLVGTAGYFIRSGLKVEHKAFVWGVYVRPEFRGKGLSRMLMTEVMKALPDHTEIVHLTVVDGNDAALGLYKSLEFEEYGYEKNALKIDEEYFHQYHMVKFLK